MKESDLMSLLSLIHDVCYNDSCAQLFKIMEEANFSRQPKKVSVDEANLKRVDHVWQIRSAFIILTMQSGFALLETGCVSAKNIANIMVKNIVDFAFGGFCYWMLGYALSFGSPSNAFCGLGNFFLLDVHKENMGTIYTEYFFQFSFASTATTIVSGAIAERMRLHAYLMFSFLNTLSYCIPVAWIWNSAGFLHKMGFYDFAGGFVVHGNGGASALVAAIMLGPRHNRFAKPADYEMSSPVTALTGAMLLWWAWFAFNTGSSLGTEGSTGVVWKVNALVAVNTLNGSVGGCIAGVLASIIFNKGRVKIVYVINSVLGSLVAITSCCSVTTPIECFSIGAVGAIVSIVTCPLLEILKIDDPVGAIPVHFFSAIWGILAVGIFGNNDFPGLLRNNGLIHGGSFYQIGVQALGACAIAVWSAVTTVVFLFIIDKSIGMRMSVEDELLGADAVEHGILKSEALRGLAHVDEAHTFTIGNGSATSQTMLIKKIGMLLRNNTLKSCSSVKAVNTISNTVDGSDSVNTSGNPQHAYQNGSVRMGNGAVSTTLTQVEGSSSVALYRAYKKTKVQPF